MNIKKNEILQAIEILEYVISQKTFQRMNKNEQAGVEYAKDELITFCECNKIGDYRVEYDEP